MANRLSTPTVAFSAFAARRRALVSVTVALLGASASTLAPCTANAQGRSPIEGTPPNVLLLVDTSGSMERMPSGALPVCTPGVAGQEPNRWGAVMQSLTGSVQPYWSCGTIHRDGASASGGAMNRATFNRAYWDAGILGPLTPQAKYDDGYALPHHRPVSGSTTDNSECAIFPDGSQSALPIFTSRTFDIGRLATYPWRPNGSGNYNFPNGQKNDLTSTTEDGNHCIFHQSDDGQMDVAARFARFGLMTFDNDPNPGTGSFLDTSGLGGLIGLPGLSGLLPGLNLNVGGQWTYLYTNSNPISQTFGVSETNKNPMFPLMGRLPGCADEVPMAVGARNQYAPSWEGPFMRFPGFEITRNELGRHNGDVQTAILAARPYGGTPIAGMMASAYDYMIRSSEPDSPRNDPYVSGGCREQFVILLTDGGPNLDLRAQELCSKDQGTQDEGTINGGGTLSYCPFFNPRRTAQRLRSDVTGSAKPITTYVVGFAVGHDTTSTPSVTNDGFPGPIATKTCAAWRASAGSDANLVSQCAIQKSAVAGAPVTQAGLAAWESTSARACCELNDIAMAGSNGVQGAFFAEGQADLIGTFARILGTIAKQSATRAVPAYSSATTVGATTQSGTFVSSFIGDPARNGGLNGTGSSNVWTGDIQRTRSVCTGGAATDQPVNLPLGDDYANNMRSTTARPRYFLTAIPERISSRVSSGESLRPYAPATPSDGVQQRNAVETLVPSGATVDSSTFRAALGSSVSANDVEDLFDVDKNTCKANTVAGGVRLEKLTDATSCARVMWGFATAATPTQLPDGSRQADNSIVGGAYAVRCPYRSSSPGPGQSTDPAVCKPLGAIIHSSPTIAGAPASLLRDEGYRKFADYFKNRRQTLYVETTDGLLHALDVNYAGPSASTTTSELWSFIPPAALPELRTNFPGGQATILDNTPVVKDVVFERAAAQVGLDTPWHTALVAGLGHDGYFALDVSADGQINNPSDFTPTSTAAGLASALRPTTGTPVGPHFLWQLTSTSENGSAEKGKKKKGKKSKNKNNQDQYAIFGDRVGTPAITTLFINDPGEPTPDGRPREVGVAILPGGIDDDVPVLGGSPAPPTCPRRTATLPVFTGSESVMNARTSVRGWGTNCSAPVSGRSVTIVRLDNGRIIRHFARATSADDDVPRRMLGGGDALVCPLSGSGGTGCRVINSPFDAPITGTPVVFPNDPGAIGQKVFVGDADGTLWRLNISDTDPGKWKAEMFLDTRGTSFAPANFVGDKPIAVPPVVSLGERGSLVINVANGDQEDLGLKPANDMHILWSVTEVPNGTSARPQLNWYLPMNSGERVTGPMAVFDRALYFASYRVNSTSNRCQDGEARIYGVDYARPQLAGDLSQGGAFRLPALPTPVQFTSEGAELVPGVSIRASQGCAEAQNTQDYFGGTRVGALMTTPVSYSLVANRSAASPTPGNSVLQIRKDLPIPRTQTIVDSWASVVE